ncbi:MAG: hypothetical protein QNJ55_16485 [Xenococcus sp. MO_188.B8]|nr:hypothetical protein [Xenococcus sp. MO_188.B8]
MFKNILKFGLPSLLLVLTPTTIVEAVSLEIFGDPIDEIVGTTSAIPGSGSSNNFPASVSVGDAARFRVRQTGETNEFAQLEIVYSADNGVADNKVMIAQTSNSQGLTDSGTASILLTLDQSGGNGEFTFKWYEALPGGTSTTPKDLEILYTTYDLDYRQEISFNSSIAQSFSLDGSTRLNYTIDSTTNVYDPSPGSKSTFNEPKNAVQVLSQESSSHSFSLGKTTGSGNALYMFEFRDPSNNITLNDPITQEVPFTFSPVIGLLTSAFFWGLGYLRRRMNLLA